MTSCKLTFVPKEDYVYHVFYRVGGGGGHQLHLKSVTLFSMILDDPNRYVSRYYWILRELGAIGPERSDNRTQTFEGPFYHDLLMGVSKSFRRQLAAGERPDPALARIMTTYSIEVNEASMLSIEEIVQADIDERNLVRQEKAETAEDEATRRRQGNRDLGHYIDWAAEEGSELRRERGENDDDRGSEINT